MAEAEDRRETDSGIEIEPVYTPADVAGLDTELPGEFPVHARPLFHDVPRPSVDDPPVRGLRLGGGDERAFPLPARARPDRPLGRVRPADPARLRLGRPCREGRGRPHRRRHRLDRGHARRLRRHPARPGLDVDDDQRARRALLLLYELAAEEQGVPGEQAPRHRPERHPQGVHRPRELHLPAAAVDADHDRPLRLLRGAAAALQHDLHLRVPHPRGGLDGGPGACLHGRERHRLLRGGGRGRPLARRVRRARLVLLQRPQRLPPGGGEVPRGPPAVGHASCGSGSAPRTRGRSRCASTRRREARRSPPSSPSSTSSASRSRRWRRSAAAPSRCTRTRSTRRSRCRPSGRRGSRCARSRCCGTRWGRRRRPTRLAARTRWRR